LPSKKKLVRIGAVQTKPRIINYRLQPAEALGEVRKALDILEQLVAKGAAAKCDALVFPEDTLGLLHWTGMNEPTARELLRDAVGEMIKRMRHAARQHHLYVVVCSDTVEADGAVYNTAFFLSRDGNELGRYHKVCPTWPESATRKRGSQFPVFPTDDLGTVGLLICYDLVMPETARCLALQGADIIFFPTMGGAAIGDDDIGFQALRVRAVENFVYLVVAQRGGGTMIISPKGNVLARAQGADDIAVADIDPFGGREGGDAMNQQRDMRARLFRERNPAAFGVLVEPNPPVLEKVPISITAEEAGRISAKTLTIGEDEFKRANALATAGKIDEAAMLFEKLRVDYRDSWIDRASKERLSRLREKH
jgi:predicted amidohydrolase